MSFRELVDVVARLRAPDGCPWDRAQSPSTMRTFVVEEAYELVEAIEGGEPAQIAEELGDLLFQIALIAQMASEAGDYDIDRVAAGIAAKLKRRHPQIFGGDLVAGEVPGGAGAWEAIKASEKAERGSILDGLPGALPALLRAHKASEKAARAGFDWPDVASVRAKIDEELAELDAAIAAGDPAEITHELGDVLQATANLSRHLGVGAEEALRDANARFEGRFRGVERLAIERGLSLRDLDDGALDALWQEVKARRAGG